MARILLADDDPVCRDIFKGLLEAGGHQVSAMAGISEMPRFLAEGAADLIITDLRFRNERGEQDVREGLAMIRLIRESGCAAPVIVLSGWPEELYGRPEEKMVTRVMVKPVGMRPLLKAIGELLG